jgi:hypothetical protein
MVPLEAGIAAKMFKDGASADYQYDDFRRNDSRGYDIGAPDIQSVASH